MSVSFVSFTMRTPRVFRGSHTKQAVHSSKIAQKSRRESANLAELRRSGPPGSQGSDWQSASRLDRTVSMRTRHHHAAGSIGFFGVQ